MAARADIGQPTDDAIALGKDRREEILATAAHLFCKRGYRSTSLQHIADVIGFTKQAIYYYFESKDQILFEIMSRTIRAGIERVRTIQREESKPSNALRRALAEHVNTVLTHLEVNVVFNREHEFLSPQRSEIIKGQQREYNLMIRQIYCDGISSGDFRGIDPTVAVNTMLVACNSAYLWYKPAGCLTVDEIAGTIIDLLASGFLAPDAKASEPAAGRAMPFAASMRDSAATHS